MMRADCVAWTGLVVFSASVLAGGASAQDAPTFVRPWDGVPNGRFTAFGRIVPIDQVNWTDDDQRSLFPDDLPPRFSEGPTTPSDSMTVMGAYFGQFIDHDLDFIREEQGDFLLPPFVRAAFVDQNGDPENRRTAGFDLDPVYGFGPLEGGSGFTQGHWFDNKGLRFRFGARDDGQIDFLRNIFTDRAKIDDMRNDENGVIGQIHRAFMQLHNATVNRIIKRDQIDEGAMQPGDATWAAVFHEARNYTTAYYQGMVTGEFSTLLTGRSIQDALDDQQYPLTPLPDGKNPVEFAFSMYRLHTIVPEPVRISETEFVSPIDPVLRDGIPWRFLHGPEAPMAGRIDSHVASSLRDIVDLAIPGVPITITMDLIQINVMRGRELKIPSGEEYIAFLLDELNLDQSTTSIRGKTILRHRNAQTFLDRKNDADLLADLKNGDTDLWAYIMLESHLNNFRLGPVGQDILERTWAGLLLHDPYSILSNTEFTEDQLAYFEAATMQGLLDLIPRPAILESATVTFGQLLDGDMTAMYGADDNAVLNMRSMPGVSAQEADLIVLDTVHRTAVATPTVMDVSLEVAYNQPGGVGRLYAKNVTTGQWDLLGAKAIGTPNNQNIENTVVFPRLNAAPYVDGDGRIEVRLRQSVVAAFSATGFDSSVDQFRVDVYHN